MRIANLRYNSRTFIGFKCGSKLGVLDVEWSRENGFPTSIEDIFNEQKMDTVRAFLNQSHSSSPSMTFLDPSTVEFLPPVPFGKKIICIGLNYKSHAEESGMRVLQIPIVFSKWCNTLSSHNSIVVKPDEVKKLDYEAELAVVIGKTAKNVEIDVALDYVFGYTNANDFSARDMQFLTSQWLIGKSYDGFCPLGPYLVTSDEVPDPRNLTISCRVNGEVVQSATTSEMIFPIDYLISYLSHKVTLEPGDIILTGTPDGVIHGKDTSEQRWLDVGDEVIVQIDNFDPLRNIVG